ncbi:oxidoreductase [Kineosporia sp. NBRC 101731]|nr:oxidoreductase [Kineosporia sp. NBRC 101731]
MLTSSICEIELRDPAGSALPPHPPGAHVSLETPAGQRRSYSITNPASETDRYVIAVHRQPDGRGGSVSVVDDTEIGSLLTVSAATSTFDLVEAPRYLLVAGGIGITPIRSMLHHLLEQARARVRLVYLTRTREETAYAEELAHPDLMDVVVLHHSAVSGRADLWPWLAEPDDQTHVYCCGSTALMDEVRALTMHWRPSHIHFEDFAGVDALGGTSAPFTLTWEPTGEPIGVAAGETALDALRRSGVRTPSSCGSGTCGTCRLRLVAGQAEHRDLVLTAQERESFVMPCVSRAAGEAITVAPL